MKNYITIFLVLLGFPLSAQITADFESFVIAPESFLNGSDGSAGFYENGILLHNEYSPDYGGFWSGWAISNVTDNNSPGFANQYSAVPGSGQGNSSNYAVSYAPFESRIVLEEELQGKVFSGMYVTNGTYPYYSMVNGDTYAKKFGGQSGNDPDYFKLTIRKYLGGQLHQDSVEFYLADYRFDDSSQDYLVNDWQFIDLKNLGAADSLSLMLSSSDSGIFGMNTPAYFCVDNITLEDGISNNQQLDKFSHITLFPNPATDFISIKTEEVQFDQYRITDLNGRLISFGKHIESNHPIDLSVLVPGRYYLQLLNNNVQVSLPFIINQ